MHGTTTTPGGTIDYSDPELRERLEERMFRITESHEAAIVLRNALARHSTGRIITNRHPGSDDFHLEMNQGTAADLLRIIETTTTEDTMTTTLPDPYPEHTRQAAILGDAEVIGRFIDEGGYMLAENRVMDGWPEPRLITTSKSTQQVLADYFGIDLDKIETEKRAMLAILLAQSGQ